MEVGELAGAKIAVDMYSVLRTEIVDRELCQLFLLQNMFICFREQTEIFCYIPY